MRIALTASLVVALVTTGAAQAKPNFTGSWINKRTDVRETANLEGVVGMKKMALEHSASSLRILRTYGQNTVSILLPLDGSKVTYTLEPGGAKTLATPRTLESRVKWNGDKLVISTEYRALESETFTEETLSLRGTELIVDRVDETRGPRGPSMRGNLPPREIYTRAAKSN